MNKKQQIDKNNLVLLAEHHKRTCSDEGCQVSLIMLRMFAEEGGLEFTKEEQEIFV